MTHFDRFRTMESYVRVVRAGSFTVAANQLGLSRALVSRHIGELETRLGVRLLNRTTRSLSVTDEGGGLQPYEAERAFERFWRARGGSGSGLGLAIVRATAERHGGRAFAAGSRFTIELPATEPVST